MRRVGSYPFSPAEGGHFEIKYAVTNGGELVTREQQPPSYQRKKLIKQGLAVEAKSLAFGEESDARSMEKRRRREEYLPERRYRDFCFALDAGARLERVMDKDEFLGNEGYIFRALGYGEWTLLACFGSPLNQKKKKIANDEEAEEGVSLNGAFLSAVPHVSNIFEDSAHSGGEGSYEEGGERVEFNDGQTYGDFISAFDDDDDDDEDNDDGDASDEGVSDEDDTNKNAKTPKKANRRKSLLQLLADSLKRFPLPVVFASGNHSNCDTLVDGLYVKYGTAIGGVLIYKSW
jgi:hypothetical protein